MSDFARLLTKSRILVGIIGYVLAGCGSSTYVIVEDRTGTTSQAIVIEGGTKDVRVNTQSGIPANVVRDGAYKVVKGDTLYAIAWRFDWDYKALARANGISSPYVIYVGQEIRFDTVALSPVDVSNPMDKKTTVAVNTIPASSTPSASSKNATKTTQVTKTVPNYKGSKKLDWQWPLHGKIVKGYSAKSETAKGIDIAAVEGSEVRAAATGQVVYAGNSIPGYGNLLIVKHNATYLSAYAYNARLLVGEGQVVSGGQVIAQSGKGVNSDGRLHFEIRKDGKAVNPLTFLK